MSYDATDWAIDQSPKLATEKLVLMALANCLNSKTNRCYPSMEFLAIKGLCSKRTAIRAIESLSNQGFISIKKTQGKSNQYRLLMPETGDTPDTGAKLSPVTHMTQTGDTPVIGLVTPMSPKQGSNNEETRKSSEQGIVNNHSGSQFPDNFELRAQTIEVLLGQHKIPDKFITEQMSEFVIYWSDRRGIQISWDGAFLKRCLHQWKLHGTQWLNFEKDNNDGTSQYRSNRGKDWNGTDWGDDIDLSEVYQSDGRQPDQQAIPESSGDLPSVEASV